jgi:hydrogenase expression/formation protein HypE
MKSRKILLDHGSGGKASHDLIKDSFLPQFNNPFLIELNDSAVVNMGNSRLAFSTDSYVVDPIFFPGGDIGSLAIDGTVNDLAMRGARPLYLSVGFIIEEGFDLSDLEKILLSMKSAAHEAEVLIVTGDTKVVSKGNADKLFINTSGIGIIEGDIDISGQNARIGDQVIISGTIGDHGIAVLSRREGLELDFPLASDSAPLNGLVSEMLEESPNIHVLRDPTRGGLGTSLNEIAAQSDVGIRIIEEEIPIRFEVLGACELLGLDPLYVANEGKLIALVAPEDANSILDKMRDNKYGHEARIIGEVVPDHNGRVFMKTRVGGTRIVDMLTGAQLPRIC